jgi:hypothetical protein
MLSFHILRFSNFSKNIFSRKLRLQATRGSNRVKLYFLSAGGPLLQTLKYRGEVVSMKTTEITEYLGKKSHLFKNGVPDIVIVHLNEKTLDGLSTRAFSIVDDVVEETTQAIKEKTSRYIALLTAQHATLPTHITWEWEPSIWVNYLILDANCTVNCTTNNTNQTLGFLDYFPGSAIQSIVMILVVLAITLCGVCCLDAIQTHDKLPRPDQTLRLKEFN